MAALNGLVENSKLTLQYYNDFGHLVTVEVRYSEMNLVPQYVNGPNEVQLVFYPKGKRKKNSKRFKSHSSFAIFEGWNLPIDSSGGVKNDGNFVEYPLCFDKSVLENTLKTADVEPIVYKVS